MILFLDAVSPIPEFSIIQENKIIYSKYILQNNELKLSDFIVSEYLSLDKKFNLDKKLNKLVVNTGPGSYTALRVGISFLYGISLSKKVPLVGISSVDLFKYVIKKEQLKTAIIYICSSNNQNYYCYNLDQKNFITKKIEDSKNLLDSDINKYTNIFSNSNLNDNLFKNYNKNIIKFNSLVNDNINEIGSRNKNKIINPIYISNNEILN